MKRLIKLRRNLLILTLANVLIFIGCSKKDDADTTAPKLPDTAALTIKDVKAQEATLSWTAASDDRTPADKLLYLVQWQASGTTEVSNSGSPQPNLTEYTLTGLSEKTAYKVWVTVTDEAGNHADYEAKDFTTPADLEYYTPERFSSWTVKPNIAKSESSYIVVQATEDVKEATVGAGAADDFDNSKLWVDLNNNGKRDEGENLPIKITFSESKVVTLYGPFTSTIIVGDIERVDVAAAPQLIGVWVGNAKEVTTLDVSALKNLESLILTDSAKLNNLIIDKNNNSKLKEIWVPGTPYQPTAKLKTLLSNLPNTNGKIVWHKEKATGAALTEAIELQNSTPWDLCYGILFPNSYPHD